MMRDAGPACADPDWQPRTLHRDPEAAWAAAFAELGEDYGGKLRGKAVDASEGQPAITPTPDAVASTGEAGTHAEQRIGEVV